MKTEEFKEKIKGIMRSKGVTGPKRRYPEECVRKKGIHKTPAYKKPEPNPFE